MTRSPWAISALLTAIIVATFATAAVAGPGFEPAAPSPTPTSSSRATPT